MVIGVPDLCRMSYVYAVVLGVSAEGLALYCFYFQEAQFNFFITIHMLILAIPVTVLL